MKAKIELFITGTVQVFFVAVNTVFLSQSLYLGVGISSFLISMIWSYNVKKIVFGTIIDRVLYSLGAMTGSLLGLFISKYLSTLIQQLWQF